MASRRPSTLRLIQITLFVVAVVALALVSPIGAAMLSPALALVAVVGLGLFTGERSVSWVRRAVRRWRRERGVPAAAPMPRRAVVRTLSARADLAFALAMRPPPHRALSL